LFSEIDPVQNNAVATAVTLPGFSETTVWSGQPGGCGNPATPNAGNCYPPAVNYTPLYYLINGVAFDKTNAHASLFQTAPAAGITPGTGKVLVRLVNAGLRMHVPSIVGSQTGTAVAPATVPPAGFSLIAEDGNVLPGIPRVQSEVFMAAGKTYDVMINAPPIGTSVLSSLALPIFDRELSLSANATAHDAGMLAYISVNGAGLPGAASGTAVANPDTYNSVIAGQTLTISDPGKGVIANDINVYGVKVSTAPTKGTLTLNADGTFTYVPNAG
jgi:FtsP/CotA-like multicopper oxidase with cupredoxin domain